MVLTIARGKKRLNIKPRKINVIKWFRFCFYSSREKFVNKSFCCPSNCSETELKPHPSAQLWLLMHDKKQPTRTGKSWDPKGHVHHSVSFDLRHYRSPCLRLRSNTVSLNRCYTLDKFSGSCQFLLGGNLFLSRSRITHEWSGKMAKIPDFICFLK